MLHGLQGIERRFTLDGHPLPLRELLPVCRSANARAIARGADTSERIDNIVANRLVVDMQKPRAQPLCDPQPASDVRRHNTHRQSVLGAVGQRDRLIIAIERHHDG
jgi:hypothetical protein